MFKELDLIIQDHCLTGENNEVDDITYQLLKDEINEHINGKLPFNKLSPIAQDIMVQWEKEEGNSKV